MDAIRQASTAVSRFSPARGSRSPIRRRWRSTAASPICSSVTWAADPALLSRMWGEEKTREYLARARFSSVEKHEPAHDVQNNWYVVRR
jgi:hypothetical protein